MICIDVFAKEAGVDKLDITYVQSYCLRVCLVGFDGREVVCCINFVVIKSWKLRRSRSVGKEGDGGFK